MTDIPENVDWQWIAHNLVANREAVGEIRRDIQEMIRDNLQGMREQLEGMREQLDAVVMTSLRLERSQAAIRQDIRELRQRLERLETTK